MGKLRLVALIFFFFFQNSFCVSILQISIPKAGTCYLREIIRNICLTKRVRLNIENVKGFLFLDENQLVKSLPTERPVHTLVVSHAVYHSYNINILNNSTFERILILRDPRDLVVSFAYYIKKYFHVWPIYSQYSIEALIYDLICSGNVHAGWADYFCPEGCDPVWPRGIKELYSLFVPWMFRLDTYVTRFERLIGPQGGGDYEEQIKEIIAIAKYIGVPINQDEAKAVAEKSFGSENSHSFRNGHIGSWKKEFTTEHKKVFKSMAGQLLIDLGYEENFDW